ncbi:AsmA-like C-terminal domain-containing protein [Benzoatithermus flavus]|uniref:AsmA-like C-terminal domain-containing protein n=1 Tax=Benzoatithermus flavus TaxID=3108223 RepID=A0ABU8XQW9_9PROT
MNRSTIGYPILMRRLARLVLAFLMLLVVAAGLLLWRLDRGPLSLAAVQPLLQQLIDRGSSFHVSFSSPTLVWSRSEGILALRLQDLEVRSSAGDFVAGAPSAAVTVAVAPLLLERRIEPVAIGLELPELELVRQADGRLVLAFAGQLTAFPLTSAVGSGGLEALLGDAAPSGGTAGLEHLRLVRVTAPSLQFYDEATGRRAVADDPLFRLRRRQDGWSVSLASRFGDGRIELAAEPGGSAGELRVVIELERFPVQNLAGIVPGLPVGGSVLPVSGRIDFPFDAATLEPGTARLQLATRQATLSLPEIGLGPVPIRRAGLVATLAAGWREAGIERLEVEGEGYGLAVSGRIAAMGDGPRVRLRIEPVDLDVAEILTLWPRELGAAARAWTSRNLRRGRVSEASLELGRGGPHPDQLGLAGSFTFADAELRYLPALPTATALAGTGRFAGDSLQLALEGGRSGEVELTGGEVLLRNLIGSGDAQLAAKLDLRSAVPAALRLLAAPPIELTKAMGLAPQAVSGRQTTRLALSLPLREGLRPEQIRYEASTRLDDLAVKNVRPGYDLAADSLMLTADPAAVSIRGGIRVNGVPLDVAWHESPGAGKGPRRQVMVTGSLDRDGVRALRFTWPERLSGRVGFDATLTEAQSPLRTVDLTLDLQPTGIRLPEALVTKQPGQPGRASARLVQPDAGTLAVERFRLDAAGVTAEGTAGLKLDPLRPERLSLRELRTPLGDLAADLALQRDVWRGRIDIGQLDLRPVLQARRESGAGEGFTPPDLALDVVARSLRLGDAPFSDLTGSVRRAGGIWQSASFRARIEDSEVGLDLGTRDGVSALALRSSDAGWLIRGFAGNDNGVRGGQLRLTADLRQGGPTLRGKGELKIREFTLWGAPLIARIVSLASFSGLGNALSGKGVPIDRLVVPFEIDGSRLLLQQARLVGSDIGARADGVIDLAQGRLDINGTVAPAYTINRILGSIPILGQILSGSQSDAAIAATFSVTGPLGEPSVAVNPLAALVPGLVRDLFNALTADTGPPEAAPQDQR